MTDAEATCVLDASAMLALLHSEPGAEAVEDVLDRAAISTVNWSEVCQRWLAHDIDVVDLRADIEALGVQIVPFTADDAEQAAALWGSTRPLGLSLGDRACLGLARRLELPAVTADRAWLDADVGIEIRPIR
ncbi:MAG: type II toxin-antitoxin system VapC family toxin [Gaiellaceae bacterium]